MNGVLDKLYGKAPCNPVGLEEPISQVYSVLRDTFVQRRGQQCVVLGARSTGKSLVINEALTKFLSEHTNNEVLVIRINGTTHSDDRIALREIAKQLDKALAASEPVIEKPSMSQTLKAINQLFGATAQRALDNPDLNFMRVVFVIEELEKYVANHQVLVYELFDLSLSSPFGVAVLATSARMNILDLLEKRNRSRNLASNIVLGKPSLEQLCLIARDMVGNLLPDEQIDEACRKVWYTSNSVRHLQSLLLQQVLELPLQVPSTAQSLLTPVDAVPEMDWALLICSARALIRYETSTVNLVIVLDEWRALAHAAHVDRFAELAARANSTIKPGSTPASLRAVRSSWERLRQLGLLVHTPGQSSQDDLRMYTPELNLDDLKSMLPKTHTLYSWTKIEM